MYVCMYVSIYIYVYICIYIICINKNVIYLPTETPSLSFPKSHSVAQLSSRGSHGITKGNREPTSVRKWQALNKHRKTMGKP